MRKIFKGQTALRITLNTFISLEGVEKAVIRYRKPNKRTGEFAAVLGDNASGLISYEVNDGDIDMSGWWVFWAFLTFMDGRTAPGEASRVFVWEQGK